MVADEITLQKVSISRIKQEMRDVYSPRRTTGDRFVRHPPRYAGQLPRLIDGFSAIIMASGSAVVAIDTEEYEVVPRHDRLLQPRPRDPHGGQHQRCGGLFRRLFQIVHQRDPDRPFGLAARLYAFRQTALPAGDTQDTHEIRQVFQLIKTILASDKEHYRQEIIRCLFTAVFYIITELNMREQKNTVKLGRGEVIFEEFMELVRQYSKQERNVRFYARRLNITPKYLSTVSKDVSGKTAARWIDEAVILEAKSLLRYSGMSIQEIAYHLNFSTQSFFGKYFKQHTGTSPSRYKRKG